MVERDEFDERLLAFERAWRDGTEPEIAHFLPTDAEAAFRCTLLVELICLDLEYRWRQHAGREESRLRVFLHEYVECFPELGTLDELPVELITEEYRVRIRWGDRPDHATFLSRFDRQRPAIAEELRRIDEEVIADASVPASVEFKPPGGTPQLRANLSYGDFLLKRMIGAGGRGKVYLAERRADRRLVAIKYLRKAFLADATAIDRFVAEAELIGRLSHPHVISTHGLGTTPHGGCFIAMKFAEGGDLSERISRGPIDVRDAVAWVAQACEAIDHVHQRGIIHCDLKPANLLLDRNGDVIVTDFGLARSLNNRPTSVDYLAGTASWMAPEQVSRYWGEISPRTDVYGLGAVLISLLTGQPPWSGHTLADVLAQVVTATPVPQPADPELPEALVTTCRRALAKPPDERFATALELRESLLQISPDG